MQLLAPLSLSASVSLGTFKLACINRKREKDDVGGGGGGGERRTAECIFTCGERWERLSISSELFQCVFKRFRQKSASSSQATFVSFIVTVKQTSAAGPIDG